MSNIAVRAAEQLRTALGDCGVPSDVFSLISGRLVVSVVPGPRPVTDGEHIRWIVLNPVGGR